MWINVLIKSCKCSKVSGRSYNFGDAHLAQLVVHLICNQGVGSSNLSVGTNKTVTPVSERTQAAVRRLFLHSQ